MTQQVLPDIVISRFDPMPNKDMQMVPGTQPITCHLYPVLESFISGVYSAIVEEVRSIEDKKKRDVYKAGALPAFTFSAVFNNRRSTENIVAHTGILVIDIDDKGINQYIEQQKLRRGHYTIEHFRDEICMPDQAGNTNILFAGLSVSGSGLFLLFKIKPEQHLDAFESIAWEFRMNYNVIIDASCKDVGRLRFATYDPNAILREWDEVETYIPPEEFYVHREREEQARKDARIKKTAIVKSTGEASARVLETAMRIVARSVEGERHNELVKASRLLGGYVGGGVIDIDTARVALQTAVAEKTDWTDPIEDMYRAIEWGLEKGMEFPLSIQVIAPDDPQWDYFTQSREERQIELNQLYQRIHALNRQGIKRELLVLANLAAEFNTDVDRLQQIVKHIYETNQDEFNIDNFPSVVKHEVYIRKRWEITMNEITQEFFIRQKGTSEKWERTSVEDTYLLVSKTGFKCNFEEINRLFKTNSLVRKFDPIQEYFKSIHKKYDGKTDYIAQLAAFFTVEDAEASYFYEMLKKMLIRTVKCAMETAYVNRYIFVMASQKQNTGKSWFLRWLSPWGMDKYYAETPMEEHKDSRIRMCEVLIYNLEELQTLTKLDVNRLKAIISQGTIKERRPYARNSESMPRRCSFWGSTNRTNFLTDDINTRWLVFNVSKIDWDYRTAINIHDLWAQATSLYLAGYDPELSQEECRIRELRNMEYTEDSFEESLLLMYFEPAALGSGGNTVLMTSSDIAARLMVLSGNSKMNISAVSIGRFLSKYGFKSERKGGVRLFSVLLRNQSETEVKDRRHFLNKPTEPTLTDNPLDQNITQNSLFGNGDEPPF